MSVGEAREVGDWREGKRLVQVHIDRDVASALNDRAHLERVPKGSIINEALRDHLGLGGAVGRSRTA